MVQRQEKFGVQCPTQGHLNMLNAGSGIEPGTFRATALEYYVSATAHFITNDWQIAFHVLQM